MSKFLRLFLVGCIGLLLGFSLPALAQIIGAQNLVLDSAGALEVNGRGLRIKLDTGSNLVRGAGGLSIDPVAQLTLDQMNWREVEEESTFGAAQTTYTLGFKVPANYFPTVHVFVGGLRLRRVTSPSTSSEFVVANSGNDTVLTFGSAPGAVLVLVEYLH